MWSYYKDEAIHVATWIELILCTGCIWTNKHNFFLLCCGSSDAIRFFSFLKWAGIKIISSSVYCTFQCGEASKVSSSAQSGEITMHHGSVMAVYSAIWGRWQTKVEKARNQVVSNSWEFLPILTPREWSHYCINVFPSTFFFFFLACDVACKYRAHWKLHMLLKKGIV